MGSLNRSRAVDAVAATVGKPPMPAAPVNMELYAEDVFSRDVMRAYLPAGVAGKLIDTIENGAPLDPAIAGDVAHAMKEWAIARGATSYTHWFLPLTGSTAEKHDSFLECGPEHAFMAFSGKNLIKGEPDASSFPSGGLRSTFEARGYTAWDPTSPAFIKRHGNGATLCIPTAFCAYTGEALDKKTPLLRSIHALKVATERLMKCFGLSGEKVSVTLGIEQEYFLIDRRFYFQRPDLLQTGRTVFGAPPAKHQQLEDHYFGSIKMRVLNFMTEVEQELWKLGIPAKTRHNEVAPAQFELAPIFEEMNLACDHNMLVMEVLRQVAERHGMVCLLHEKPFAGVNGSGKHNNWSIGYGDRNLLNPGSDPQANAIFMTVLCAIIAAVDRHADLLRASVAGAGNDHRLGANEAPPAVISMYLGEQLTDIIEEIEKGQVKSAKSAAGSLRIGVDTLPALPRDTSDRNRTSPFAFTGNKFEFRAPGSSQNCSGPNVILNTIVAEAFDAMSDRLEKLAPDAFQAGLQKLLSSTIRKHKRIIFNGDGYTGAWLEEAARRGLPNAPTTMEALAALTRPENVALFEKYGVFGSRELISRHEVFMEDFHRRIAIEANIALEIADTMIAPAAAAEFGRIAQFLAAVRTAGDLGTHGGAMLADRGKHIGEAMHELGGRTDKLRSAIASGGHRDILAAMSGLRATVDALERLLPDDAWPLPKYREMLFIY